MPRREISESRAAKLALLQQLSARRAERSLRDGVGGVSASKRCIVGLSDSGTDIEADIDDASVSSSSSDTPSSGDPEPLASYRAVETQKERSGFDIADQLSGALRLNENDDSSNVPGARSSQEGTSTPAGTRVAPRRFRLLPDLEAKLYDYQRHGVQWMFGLWKVGAGGILADDMGLGKTFQTCCFLSGILIDSLAKRALVVAPTTLLATWQKELDLCGLQNRVLEYSGSPLARQRAFDSVVRNGGVLLASYGMILHNAPTLKSHPQHDADEGPLWDVIVMDEGHKLKNPKMQLRQSIDMLPARQRLILSGTPIQNNLMEMHTLFDVVCPGILGDARYFKDHYERRITAGTDKHATVGERERGAMAAADLRQLVAPYMLRREKKDVLPPKTNSIKEQDALPVPSTPPTSMQMPMKNDLVVWLRLNPRQRALYQAFLNSDAVRAALNRTMSPLASLTVLKKLCDHPALLSENAQLGVLTGAHDSLWEGTSISDGVLQTLEASSGLEASCKTVFVLDLLRILIPAGHRTLIFSQSRKMLDILEASPKAANWQFCRIDGSVPTEERQTRVNVFQNDRSIPVFLLTSQVGGLGLTLTEADRVVIVDPAWNPSVDSQSVDRAYRIGQTKNVVVYRLISCGTVEDKIYRKQVFKGGLSRTGTQSGEQFRYFTASELRDLYRLDPLESYKSSTMLQLHTLHAHQRKATPELDAHLQRVQSLEGVVGVSDHDLLYSVKAADGPDPEKGVAGPIPSPAKSVLRGMQQPLQRGKTFAKTGNVTWNGQSSDISEAFSRALSLSERNKEETKQEARDKELDRLRNVLQKQESLLADGSLASSLVDGGAKIRAKILALKQEIASLEQGNKDKIKKVEGEIDGEPETLSTVKKSLYLAAKRLERMNQADKGEMSNEEVVKQLRREVQELANKYDAMKSEQATLPPANE
jgi:superfamily II DNA or RNA helicase